MRVIDQSKIDTAKGRENIENNQKTGDERDAQFVARWRDRLWKPLKTIDRHFASNGLGSYIEVFGIPVGWYDQLDAFFESVQQRAPHFQIFQCKLKFGEVRVYLSGIDDEIRKEADQLSERLSDPSLIF